MAEVRPPDGFTLALPEGWVTLDLGPGSGESARKRLVDALVRNDPSIEEHRDGIEGFLSAAAAGAAEDEALLCALHVDGDADGRPLVATVLVTIRSVEGPADPGVLLADLGQAGVEADEIDLAAGRALRVCDRTEEGMLTFGALIPVPGADGRIAVVSLVSPTTADETELSALFEAVADTFAFNWEGDGRAVG